MVTHVFLHRRVLERFRTECRLAKGCETGGPLAGYCTTNGHIVVTHGGGPGPYARLRRHAVFLDGMDTWNWLEQVYSLTGGKVWFVGDWHRHVGYSLMPSYKDHLATRTLAEYPDYNMPHALSVIYRTRTWKYQEAVAVYTWTGTCLVPVAWCWWEPTGDCH